MVSNIRQDILTEVLDCLIPEDPPMPSAGTVGVDIYIQSVCEQSSVTESVVIDVLNQTDKVSEEQMGAPFVELPNDDKTAVLHAVEESCSTLFNDFLTLTYKGYYTNPKVVEVIGPDAGPPQPDGFTVKPFDERSVDRVRQAGPLYKEI